MAAPIRIQTYHVARFASYLERLAATPDGDGSLRDHTILLFGSGISNSDRHTHGPLPTLLVGRGEAAIIATSCASSLATYALSSMPNA